MRNLNGQTETVKNEGFNVNWTQSKCIEIQGEIHSASSVTTCPFLIGKT